MIRVTIADDHHLVREGLQVMLGDAEGISLVGVATSGQEAIALASELSPDVMLMDLSMSPVSGIEAARTIHLEHPDIAIVALTAFREDRRVLASLDAGMIGYVVKDAPPEDILRAVRDASVGASYLDSTAARALVDSRDRSRLSLTTREKDVLELIEAGLTNRQIGAQLGIAEKTVKAHLTSVYSTIGAPDRASAARWAREHGFHS